jgi:hypothetical protein
MNIPEICKGVKIHNCQNYQRHNSLLYTSQHRRDIHEISAGQPHTTSSLGFPYFSILMSINITLHFHTFVSAS